MMSRSSKGLLKRWSTLSAVAAVCFGAQDSEHQALTAGSEIANYPAEGPGP
jgi:hypothetical protein